MAQLRHFRVDAIVAAVLAAVLVVSAFLHPGVAAKEVELNDGGVWVTSTRDRLAGHLNYQSRTLDGGLQPATTTFDVTQAGNDVLLAEGGTGVYHRVDTAQLKLTDRLAAANLQVSHGGRSVGIADADGNVWAVGTADLSGFSTSGDPMLEEVPGARVVTGTNGVVHVVASDGTLRRISQDAAGAWVSTDDGRLSESLPDGQVDLTVVGDEVVALDRGSNRVITKAARHVVPSGAVLQLPGAKNDAVLVETPRALLTIPLSQGTPQETPVPNAGKPIAPAFLDGCSYAAWGGSGHYVRRCQGQPDVIDRPQKLVGAQELVFRVSRGVIVLNDAGNGSVFLVNEGMLLVNNWDAIKNQTSEKNQQNQQQSEQESPTKRPKDPNSQQPPIAVNDTFGVRAGRQTSLPVGLNDIDEDGDPLTAQLVGSVTGPYGVVGASGGRSLRVDVPAGSSGSMQLSYRANDGRALSKNTATVTVNVVDATVNTAPKPPAVVPRIQIARGKQVAFSSLPGWSDPEGDQFFLKSAGAVPGRLDVKYRQDGLLTIREVGAGTPGTVRVPLEVSDGTAVGSGVVEVEVVNGNVAPVANADFTTVAAGAAVEVRPLANDTDANQDPLMLTETSKAGQAETVTMNAEAGTFRFSSTRPGTHFVQYSVSDGPNVSQGEVRIEVLDPDKTDAAPAAQDDVALVPANGAVIVDALANDTDPLGGVLILTGFTVPEGSPLAVEVIDHHVLRVSAPVGLKEPTSFEYQISNGAKTAKGRVLVLPLPAAESTVPPVAQDDEMLVRAGDIGSANVLINDYSPTNMELSVETTVEVKPDSGLGEAFVAGDRVRFRAGQRAGTARITYTIRDSVGNVDSAEIKVTVVDATAANQAPVPQRLEARLVAGSSTKLAVPLDGIDPNGDSVLLDGIGGVAPSKGTIVKIERGFLVLEAPATVTPGTDRFTYRVKDRYGSTGEADVVVGIAAPPGQNLAPVAVTDVRHVRPGRTLAVPVTANDLDPDGDQIALVDGSVVPADEQTTTPTKLLGQKVEVTVPNQATTLQYYYDIVDGKGGRARGALIIKVSEDVPLQAPIAVDDPLTAADVAGKQELSVDALLNDSDPDGSASKLALTVEAPGRVANGQVVVPVQDDRQVILYTITDPDGLTSKAAIVVPGANQVPPTLRPEKLPAKVKGGETLTIDLAEYVLTRPGHRAILTSGNVTVGRGLPPATLKGDKAVVVVPDTLFIGATSVSFEVTDGETVEDPRGLKARLSVPITVESSGRFPPVLRPSEVTVAPGEEPVSAEMRQMVTDPDPGDLDTMRYEVRGVTGPFKVSVRGSSLSVSVPADTRTGTRGRATIRVSDGTTDPKEMDVALRVTASTRPLIQTTDYEAEGRSGEPSQINLAGYVTNPFADQGKPVTITGARVVSGSGTAQPTGLGLTVTPDARFDGQLVVSYTAQDATKDASRQVQGTVRLTIKGKPDAPTFVLAESKASRSATVRWTAGNLRGGTLTKFTVRWAGGSSGSQDCGRQTVCEIAGKLINDKEYTFTVTQTTEVGESVPSGASAPVRPDVRPNPPSTPLTQFGDRQIGLTWRDGGSEGSPVSSYSIQVTPAVGGRTEIANVTGTSYVMAGLTNGTAYRFKVKAHNEHPDPSDWSGASAPEVPAGAPSVPLSIAVDKASVSTALPRATLSWTPPADPNGDSAFEYEVMRVGGAVVYKGPARSTTITLEVSTADQTFQVRATNKSKKWSGYTRSQSVRGWQLPGPPRNLTLTPTGQDNQVRFTFNAAQGNGAQPSEISYRWDGGTVVDGQVVTSGLFQNGQTVTVQLRAVASVNGESASGPAVSASVNAYGPPVAPGINCSGGYRTVECSWDGGSGNGRGVSYWLSDAAGGAVSSSGRRTFDVGFGESRRLCINATQEAPGNRVATNCESATAWGAPHASWRSSGQAAGGGFYYADILLERFRPGYAVYCSVGSTSANLGSWSKTFTVDGGGNWGWGRAPGGLQATPSGFNDDFNSSCRQG